MRQSQISWIACAWVLGVIMNLQKPEAELPLFFIDRVRVLDHVIWRHIDPLGFQFSILRWVTRQVD